MTENKVRPVRYMDFVGTRRAASTDPLISRPKSRPVTPVKPVAKPENPKETVKVEKSTEKPMISRKPATSRDLYPTTKPAAAPAKPVSKPVEKPTQPSAKSEPKEPAKKPAEKPKSTPEKAPDNNSYSLGGKSPFLPNVSVEKRGLSDSVPEKKKPNFESVSYLGVNDASEKTRKNVYEKKEIIDLEPDKPKKKESKKTVKIIDNKEKKSGVPLVVIIILTIVLGALVGTGVYFLLPK